MSRYSSQTEELLRSLNTDPERGLGAEECAARLEKYGENRLAEGRKKTMLSRFFDQFKDAMILILIAAAAVSFFVALREGDAGEFFEPVLILLIVVLNALMGVFQESRAEKALEALKSMSAQHARVIRGGREERLDASQLVPGDIIRLEAGDFIPADVRLLETSAFKCEESALTGESVPAEKDADAVLPPDTPLGDRVNMAFSGCSVSYGTALAVVTATGMGTEMGRIAKLLNGAEEAKTPLQEKLAQLGKYLGIMALAACAVIFAVGLMNGIPVMDIFMTAVSLAVSAIPEGLPAIVTVVLSIGVQRMVKKNAIIRRLPAVETLGSASVICSDKTGTLTMNRMTLTHVFAGGELAEMDELSGAHLELLRSAALCCDGSVIVESNGDETHIGDPTETSIVLAALRRGMDKDSINAQSPRVFELPFDSDRKLMTTVNRIGGRLTVITKGAFDMLEKRCVSGDTDSCRRAVEQMSEKALRVLAVAVKTIDELPQDPGSENLEQGLTMLGLVGMIDPPRPEARDAVAVCRRAGITPVMITGDHVTTASAIARELGILTEKGLAITGAQLDEMDDDKLDSMVEKISVYARVSPENKIRIVRAWQKKGHVVSMTGDGVNDAPALKAADIGCAMGITGTDVAKGAADMTLTDDNFSTIVDAVREGRGIFANIRKVVGFLLGTNIGEVITVFVAMLLWHTSPLLSMQLLWINLVTDSLPAVALGMEPVERDVMERPPRPRDESLFAHGYGVRIALQGVMFSLLSLAAFRIGTACFGLEGGRTMTFMVLALSQLVQSYNMRSEHSLFKIGAFGNRHLNLAVLASAVLVALVLFTPLHSVFGLMILPANMYFAGLALAFVPLLVMELAKAAGIIKHHKH
ncbi:MAG: calcium-translocating P-type ATPase, PMCA-type [Candidatus Heteroscillospira sp.]